MSDIELKKLVEQVYEDGYESVDAIERVLGWCGDVEYLFNFADRVRAENFGDGVYLRGLLEFSSFCVNSCYYCGLRSANESISRYRMTCEQILECVDSMWNHGMRTVVLQSGEWPDMEASWLCEVIRQIKWRYDMAVTLSVGERSFEDYKLWREAGADRYLLKIETTDEDLYGELHPGMSFSRRLECLGELNFLDYQTGSGNIVGLKGQSLRSLAADIAFFGRNKIDMIGIGPFISQAETPLCGASVGSTELTLRVLALTRIVTRSALMPTTTALETVTVGGRELGLRAGANVVMISFTPVQYRDLYSIYPRKDIGRNVGAVIKEIEKICIENGRNIDYSRGDAARLN